MTKTVLVVEDERKISALICSYLKLEGFNCIPVYDGLAALARFSEGGINFVVLDLMLPKLDGLQVCEAIRSQSEVPIMLLTARVEDVDRLVGLAKGADDYLCKPFNPQELVARVKAILRRVEPKFEKNEWKIGPLLLSEAERLLKRSDTEIPLTQIEFSLLKTLMSNPRKVFSREDLLSSAQGKYSDGYERTIDFHIKNLRKKINSDEGLQYIKTVYGAGYKFL